MLQLVMNMSTPLNMFSSCYHTCGVSSCPLSLPLCYPLFPTVSSHLCQPFTSHTVCLGTMYEPLPSSKPVAALLSCRVVKKLNFKCYVFTRPLLKGILSQSAADWRKNILCSMKRGCGVHAHTYRDLKLTDQSLTSKNNKPALSQDPHCQVSQQMRSICGRWCPVQVPACMPQ